MTDYVSMREDAPLTAEELLKMKEKREAEEWARVVKVEAEVQLKAEKFREDVELAKEAAQPTLLKNRIIKWLRKL